MRASSSALRASSVGGPAESLSWTASRTDSRRVCRLKGPLGSAPSPGTLNDTAINSPNAAAYQRRLKLIQVRDWYLIDIDAAAARDSTPLACLLKYRVSEFKLRQLGFAVGILQRCGLTLRNCNTKGVSMPCHSHIGLLTQI